GQSGTPQALTAAGHESGGIGGLVGSVAGALLEHIVGAHSGGAAGAIVGSKLGEAMTSLFGHGNQQVMAAVDNIRRPAPTDPAFARNLLMKYQPSLPSSAARRAMAYVANRTPGFAAG